MKHIPFQYIFRTCPECGYDKLALEKWDNPMSMTLRMRLSCTKCHIQTECRYLLMLSTSLPMDQYIQEYVDVMYRELRFDNLDAEIDKDWAELQAELATEFDEEPKEEKKWQTSKTEQRRLRSQQQKKYYDHLKYVGGVSSQGSQLSRFSQTDLNTSKRQTGLRSKYYERELSQQPYVPIILEHYNSKQTKRKRM